MFRLITLGRIELTDARGRTVEEILKRPKRLALLTYLAVAGEGVLRSRDTVLGLFWPEYGQAQARQALNQSLYVLRRQLGRDVVLSVGNDQIGLAAGGIWCDAVALRKAAASGDQRSVQTHYRGEFLPGFFLSDTPDFEKWLDQERTSLQRIASASAWKLAEESEGAGDLETAAWAAARSAELSQREEAAVRRAIELLDRVGDRARALALYQDLETSLAEELGTRPAPETQEVVARVRAREAPEDVARAAAGPERGAQAAPSGPRASPPWEAEGAQRPASGGASDRDEASPYRPTDSMGARPKPRARRAALIALPLAGMALLALWLTTRPPEPVGADTIADPHLMIEPFEAYEGDGRLTDIAGAITAGLAARLAEVDVIDVMLIQGGATPTADSAMIAHEAAPSSQRAWFVLRGRVTRDGNRMRASVSLIDRASGQVIGSAKIDRVTENPLGFIDDATEDAETFARAAIGRELRERAWRASTDDVAAWQLLERAEGDRLDAVALREDEAYAAAAIALAHADSLLLQAESIEARWVPPIVVRAQVAYDRMWTAMFLGESPYAFIDEGIAHADRALALDSTDARAQEIRGMLLYWRALHQPASTDVVSSVMGAAEAAIRSGVRADPHRAQAWVTLSALLYHSGRYAEGYHASQRAHQEDAFLDRPQDILLKLFTGAFETDDDDAARQWCIELRERFPGSSSGIGCALTLLAWADSSGGTSQDAWALLDRSGIDSSHRLRPYFELQVASVLAREGEADSALSMVRRARASAAWNAELVPVEAAIRLALGQNDTASILLRGYVDEKPATRQGTLVGRRFRALRE